jgi:PQQ-dependent dehydrogenase (methanol/ethanol family)
VTKRTLSHRIRVAAVVGSTSLAAYLGTSFLSPSAGLASGPANPAGDRGWVLGGNAEGWQFDDQAQINDQNVSRLGLAWAADIPSPAGLVGMPLVAGGVVYQSGPGGVVYANDGRTGKMLWQFTPETRYDQPHSLVAFWAMRHNRGLAIDNDQVYVAAGDCRLFALDRKTGAQKWMTEACDPTQPYGITAAPRVGGGMVFTGNANGDLNTARGFVSAFDAKTGKQLWRFYTRPGDPAKPFESDVMKMAASTWGKNYWPASTGGAQVWDGMTYDPELGLLYIGTNGPLPHEPAGRGKEPGDELFSSAIVAVDAKTGRYVWHFTEVPHDNWELSAISPIQIANVTLGGQQRRVLMQAPKNGFFYMLDARTGKFISAGQMVPQNWTKGIDPASGRPIPNPDAEYWNRRDQDTLMIPGTNGARTWEPMAYSPRTSLVYVPTRTMATMYRRDGKYDWYYPLQKDATVKAQGHLIAWDPIRQKEVWRIDRPSTHNGGTLVTAGNLVFQGTVEGTFEALDAKTGRKLWSFQGDGAIMGAPSAAVIDGVQYIFVATGDSGASAQTHSGGAFNSSRATQGPPRLLAFRLDGKGELSQSQYPPLSLPKPWRSRQPLALAQEGEKVFEDNTCELCHGVAAIQGARDIPDLRASNKDTYAAMSDILKGAYRPAGMPSFPNITGEQIVALQAFMTNRAWAGYEEQEAQKK